MNYNEKGAFLISKSISDSSFIFLFIAVFTFPGFILHYRYETLNKNRKIIFKHNYLEIATGAKVKNILYLDILEVENHSVAWKVRNPWSDYRYVKLNLKNGEKIYYNCLTTKINSENHLLKNDRIKKFEREDIYPWY